MEPITWTNVKVKLGDLIPWPRNPRLIFEEEARRLVKSYKEFNQSEMILIEPGEQPGQYGLLNGHQRLKVWGSEFGPELEVDCRLASRRLTEREKEKMTVYLHKGTIGRFDMELLSGWETEDLIDWGFSRLELGLDPAGFGDGEGDEEPDGDQPPELPPATGDLLALTNVTIAEPRHHVEAGQVWRLGHHVLICVSVINEWQAWLPYLENGCLFVPYPGPFVALSDRAEEYKMILVQPDPYIAGHILDRYADIGGEEMVTQAAEAING